MEQEVVFFADEINCLFGPSVQWLCAHNELQETVYQS
jgi:hypothetical protein